MARRIYGNRGGLLALALGLTATAHIAAALAGLLLALGFMLYLAESRCPAVMQVLMASSLGACFILFASCALPPAPSAICWRRLRFVFCCACDVPTKDGHEKNADKALREIGIAHFSKILCEAAFFLPKRARFASSSILF